MLKVCKDWGNRNNFQGTGEDVDFKMGDEHFLKNDLFIPDIVEDFCFVS